jgi:hypothetical protein
LAGLFLEVVFDVLFSDTLEILESEDQLDFDIFPDSGDAPESPG